jgi:hypothetical protein
MYSVYQYPSVYSDFLVLCQGDDEMLAEIESVIRSLKEEGPNCPYPMARPLRDGIFELRPQTESGPGRQSRKGRLLYCWDEEQALDGEIKPRAIIVYAFFKTTRKTPDQHIETAKRRCQELLKKAKEIPI